MSKLFASSAPGRRAARRRRATDPRVLEKVKKEAKERDIGYQTLINDILAKYAKRAHAKA